MSPTRESPKGKSRWRPFSVELSYEELERIVNALNEVRPGTKLAADLRETMKDVWRYLP